jgi:hypothetical protein
MVSQTQVRVMEQAEWLLLVVLYCLPFGPEENIQTFACFLYITFLTYSWTLKTGAVCFSDTSVNLYRIALHYSQSQSQSYFTTDGQSVSSFWCRAQFGTFDQRFFFWKLGNNIYLLNCWVMHPVARVSPIQLYELGHYDFQTRCPINIYREVCI